MAEDLKRLKAQQEANSAAIARMQMQMQAQNARRGAADDEDEEDDVTPPAAQGNRQPPQQQQQYQQVDPNLAVLQHLTAQAANAATHQVQKNLNASHDIEAKIKARMQRLVSDYPALTQEDSDLVIQSRAIYTRIASENPALDEATKYELAVREAASLIGARPVNAPIDAYASQDFVVPAGRNPSLPTRTTKSRLTPNIIANAKLMGINVDPNSVEGKKNLAELSEYSARFNADQDESQFRYR